MFFVLEWIFSFVGFFVSMIGIGIVGVGIIRATILLASSLMSYHMIQTDMYRHARLLLAQHILLGLEFMVASDVIATVFTQDYKSLITLFALVIVRTILVHSLDKEVKELHSKVD